jgi:hypothetical protein
MPGFQSAKAGDLDLVRRSQPTERHSVEILRNFTFKREPVVPLISLIGFPEDTSEDLTAILVRQGYFAGVLSGP